MSEDWSLASELCQAARQGSIDQAVVELALIEPSDHLKGVKGHGPWRRGGAETHIFPFSTISVEGGERMYIIKAYTPTSIGASLESRMEKMFLRRNALEASGILSPKVFYRGAGIWIEKYIPLTLEEALGDALKGGDLERQKQLLVGVCSIVRTLDLAGYETVALCGDLRAEDSTVYMVDFGTDLGGGGLSRSRDHNTASMVEWLGKVDNRLILMANDLLLKLASPIETRQ